MRKWRVDTSLLPRLILIELNRLARTRISLVGDQALDDLKLRDGSISAHWVAGC